MRAEDIKYIPELPLNISLVSIENYPLHWHNSIQIVMVLEGSVDIEIGTDFYNIMQGEIEIVNPNEVHSFKSTGEQNLLLIFNIDPNFLSNIIKAQKTYFFTLILPSEKFKSLPDMKNLEIIFPYSIMKQLSNMKIIKMKYKTGFYQ